MSTHGQQTPNRRPPTCTACNKAMEPGFIPDTGHNTILQMRWCPGDPISGWITGEVKGKQVREGLKVVTFRCPSCGLLQSHAQDPAT